MIEIGEYNINIKNIILFKIGNRSYNIKSYEKNNFKGDQISVYYKLLKNNINKITYILVKNYSKNWSELNPTCRNNKKHFRTSRKSL